MPGSGKPTVSVGPGRWEPWTGGDKRGAHAALVVEGMLCRTVTIGRQASTEVIGPGDVVRPWDEVDGVSWFVVERSELVLIDDDVMRSLGDRPDLVAQLVTQGMQRSHSYATLVASSRVKRVDLRLLALFRQLAARWGKVGPDGVVVPLNLTHAQLASIVGAHRPSVTSALSRLAERGVVRRHSESGYVLSAEDVKSG
jgi:CRP/FNR family transcriptional regulator, cyclic AMP receptor protein